MPARMARTYPRMIDLVGRVWQRLNLAIRRSLHDVSLAQLAGIDSSQVRLPTLEREVKLATPRVPVRS